MDMWWLGPFIGIKVKSKRTNPHESGHSVIIPLVNLLYTIHIGLHKIGSVRPKELGDLPRDRS